MNFLLKLLLVIILIIILMIKLTPDLWESTVDKIKVLVSGTSIEVTTPNNDTHNFSYEEEIDVVEETVLIDEWPSLCGGDYKGLPDYEGTNMEGFDCSDSINGDNECLTSAPTNYDGSINKLFKTSSPVIRCCQIDGYCYW